MALSVTVLRGCRTTVWLLLVLFMAGGVQAQAQRTYTVRPGDTLYRIAVNNNMSVEQLQQLNGLTGTLIKIGQVLRLSVGPVDDTVRTDSASVATPPTTDPALAEGAATGDSVAVAAPGEAIASQGPEDLEPADIIDLSTVRPVTDSTGAVVFGEYTAASGVSFYELSYTLGIPVDTLEALNPGHATVLADGDPVRLPAAFARTSHTVRQGDTLYRLASRYGVGVDAIQAANPGLGTMLRVGQTLVVPAGGGSVQARIPAVVAQGPASVYPDQFQGRLMASGSEYDPAAFTVAHPALPFGTVVLIENAETSVSTFAEVADRMPVSTEFVVEVSRAVAEAVALGSAGVRVRIIRPGNRH